MVCLGFASAASHFIPKDVSRSFDSYPNSNDSYLVYVSCTRTVDRFVPILTFSNEQSPDMSRNTLVQGREKTSIVAYNKLVESNE